MIQGMQNTLDARKTYLSNRSKFKSESENMQIINSSHRKSNSMFSRTDAKMKETMIEKATDNSFFSLR